MGSSARTLGGAERRGYREVAKEHFAAAREPGKPWWEWKRLCQCGPCVRCRAEKLEQALAGP